MKKIIIALMALIVATTSCSEDFLIVSSTTSILADDYYNSQERIYSALVAAYDPLQWFDYFYSFTPLNVMSDIMSDDVYPGGSSATDNEFWHLMHGFKATAENVCSTVWTICYSGINRANIVVDKIDGVEDIDSETKAQYIAEAVTLRAYYYSILWKFWGNIPHYTENPDVEPFLVDQLSADEVYELIIVDLDFVIEGDVLMTDVSAANKGHVCRAMAQMLKAEVVMYQNDDSRYSEALADMEEIIGTNIYSLYGDFASLWEEEGEWCSESIWEVNYSDVNCERSWSWANGTGGTVTPVLLGINGLSGSSDYNAGWGFGTVREELYLSYDENDTRRDGGILSFAKYEAENPGVSYTARYQDTGYFLLKYLPRADGNANCSVDVDLNYNNNLRIYRYAETLLNAAELSLRTGGSNAQTYLNEVRARAFDCEVSELSSKGYYLTATLDNIIAERRLELYGEGKRYWDLIRTGSATTLLADRGYTDSKKYLPIPSSEIDSAAGTLTQNNY
ncbi:MAG: RagB/SusD family nutrient uptake outer membrane protein [Rikenellaceae bacterium]